MRRRRIARNAHIQSLRADRRDRHQCHAQDQIEIVPHPCRGGGQRVTGTLRILRRDRETRAVTAERKRKIAAVERIGDRRDHRRARHVHRLVAIVRDRPGRLHDIGDTDQPAVRHRAIQRRLHQAGEAMKHRHGAVERIARHVRAPVVRSAHALTVSNATNDWPYRFTSPTFRRADCLPQHRLP